MQCLSFANISRLQLKIKLIVLRNNSIVESNRRRHCQYQERKWGRWGGEASHGVNNYDFNTHKFSKIKKKNLKNIFFHFFWFYCRPTAFKLANNLIPFNCWLIQVQSRGNCFDLTDCMQDETFMGIDSI